MGLKCGANQTELRGLVVQLFNATLKKVIFHIFRHSSKMQKGKIV